MVAVHKIDKVIEALGPFLHLRSFLVSHTRFAAPAQLALKKIWTRSRNTADNTRWGRRAMEGRGKGRGESDEGSPRFLLGRTDMDIDMRLASRMFLKPQKACLVHVMLRHVSPLVLQVSHLNFGHSFRIADGPFTPDYFSSET